MGYYIFNPFTRKLDNTGADGVTQHSLLSGLAGDDHTGYTLADGSRDQASLAVTGMLSAASIWGSQVSFQSITASTVNVQSIIASTVSLGSIWASEASFSSITVSTLKPTSFIYNVNPTSNYVLTCDTVGSGVWLANVPTPAVGQVVQFVNYQLSTMFTGTARVSYGTGTMQITEGFEVLSATITPKSGSNFLLVDVTLHGGTTVSNYAALVGLFKNSGSNAVAANTTYFANLYGEIITPVRYYFSAGSATAISFVVRAGLYTSGIVLTINGLAGVAYIPPIWSAISIWEIKA